MRFDNSRYLWDTLFTIKNYQRLRTGVVAVEVEPRELGVGGNPMLTRTVTGLGSREPKPGVAGSRLHRNATVSRLRVSDQESRTQ